MKNKPSDLSKDNSSPAVALLKQALTLVTSSEKINKEVTRHIEEFKNTYGEQFKGVLRLNCLLEDSMLTLAETDPKELMKLEELARKDWEENAAEYSKYL